MALWVYPQLKAHVVAVSGHALGACCTEGSVDCVFVSLVSRDCKGVWSTVLERRHEALV